MRAFVLGLATALLFPALSASATGAIAVDDEAGRGAREVGFGYVVGRDSRSDASAGAMRECRRHGNDGCKVVVWFEQCGAYASSREHAGIGYGNSERAARARAMDDCGSDRCHIVVAACEN